MTFDEQHAVYRVRCEEALSAAAEAYFQSMSMVSAAARYSLLDGGKRVRGVLTMAVCDMLEGDFRAADTFAAALEMIHAFSLIHDDLPAMDDDNMRRGRPSCHIAFGEANALLAGDMLAITPFEVIAKAPFADRLRAEAVAVLAAAAGGRGMIYGQELDIKNEGEEVDEATLCAIQQNKTGALIFAAIQLGALAAGAEAESCPALMTFADNIGLAFQIVDDILDEVSTVDQLGKPTGSDAKNKKATFVSVNGLVMAQNKTRTLTESACLLLQQAYGPAAGFLCEYARKLAQRAY